MSEHTESLEAQIAALQSALALPLPEGSRWQLEQDLRALEAHRAARSATTSGTTEVSGTLHGNAVGVNYGTVQTFFGDRLQAAGAASATPSADDIADQRALLEAHRRTLAIYLKQQAQLSSAYVPPGVEHGIREARVGIERCKAALRGWGAAVTDHPNDQENTGSTPYG